jgi:hypothetical protein
MKRTLLIIILLIVLQSCSFATSLGTIKVVVPEGRNVVTIDDVVVEVEERNRVIVRLERGEHIVRLVGSDGTILFKKSVRVSEGEVATVVPDISGVAKIDSGLASERPVSKEIEKKQIKIDSTMWGSGFGLGFGIDNSNYTLSGGDKKVSKDIGIQSSFSVFYARPLFEAWLTEFEIDFLRQGGAYDKSNITAYPLTFSVKRRMNSNYMIGFGLNYSSWQKSSDIEDIAPGMGMQIFTELKQISTEIGYIVKTGAMNYMADNKVIANSSGLYFKYKFYL